MVPSSTGPSSGRGGCPRELWSSISCPPIARLFNLCVVATCHGRIGWRVLDSYETFHFSHVFLGTSFLNPLCSLSVLTFSKFQSLLCLLLRIFNFFCALLLWFLRSTPWFLSFTFFFKYAPLFFLLFLSFWSFTCFLFLCFVPFLNFAFSVSLMVDYSDIRRTSPSVSFFFACLGVFISFSGGHCPQIGDFTLGNSNLSLVLGDLYLVVSIPMLVWVGARDSKEGKYKFWS